MFSNFGGRDSFMGEMLPHNVTKTIGRPEADQPVTRQSAGGVDGGGSLRRALLAI